MKTSPGFRKSLFSLLTLSLTLPFALSSARAEEFFVYFGTYTRNNDSKGIYLSKFDTATGKLSAPEVAGEVVNPSFLAIHPDGAHLYAVSEIPELDSRKTGGLSAFEIDPATGKLELLNQEPTEGPGPCFVAIDHSGKAALVANYSGGSVASLPIEESGALGPVASFIQHEGSSINERRQKEPHAHSINVDAANRFAFAADLGTDDIFIYELLPDKAILTSHGSAEVAPGSGPRHFAFHPSGKYAYVINELALTITAFRYDAEEGRLTEIQTVSTVPADADREGVSTAEVQAHPNGKFVYGSNRGHDSIAAFQVEPTTGKLFLVEIQKMEGNVPRNFRIDPTGGYLLAAGQKSNTVEVFAIDAETGALEPTGEKIEVPSPVCVKFLPVK